MKIYVVIEENLETKKAFKSLEEAKEYVFSFKTNLTNPLVFKINECELIL